jgi:transposase
METCALLAPVAVGLKVTLIVQLAFVARVAPQVLVWGKSPRLVPTSVTPLIFRCKLSPFEWYKNSGRSEARQLVRRTRQVTRRKFPAEKKIRIVLEGIRGELAVSELCRREGIHPTIYYKWLKDFMEAGKGRLRGDTKREATTEEVRQVGEENARLKQLVAELSLANLTLKKSLF